MDSDYENNGESRRLLEQDFVHRRYSSKVEHAYDNTTFSVESSEIFENISGQNREAEETISAEELLYQLQYAFITPEFRPVEAINRAQANLGAYEKIQFKEKLLEGLKDTSIPIKEKITIYRLIKDNSGSRARQRNAQKYIQTKSRHGYAQYLILWENTITKLAAYFGSNVASYFQFLRTLLYLNFLTGVLMFCFTTVPQIISGDLDLIIPENLFVNESGHFGLLSSSLMFYGTYVNEVDEMYDQPLAYFLTWLVIGLVTLIFIVVSMHIRYRRSKLSDKGDEYPFSWSLFCSWDHSITTRAGVRDHFRALCTTMKEKIREERSFEVISLMKRLLIYLGRLVSNVIVLGMLAGSGYLIYYVEEKFVLPEEAPDVIEELFEKYQLAVVVAVLKILVPLFFAYLVKIEKWHPRVELKLTIFRTMFFYFASLVVFILSLSNLAKCASSDDACADAKNSSQTISQSPNTTSTFCCWENKVGEEIFKLILIDLGLLIVVGLLVNVSRALFVKYTVCPCHLEYSEFAVTANILDLVYGQGLIWLGIYFSPILPLIGVAKLIIVFYFRYFVARVANVPPKKLFRASRSGSFYFFLLLLTWILCTAPVAYFLIDLTPSWHCGPFQCNERVYDVIKIDVALPSWLDWLNDLWSYFSTAIVIVPVIIVLLLVVLYYRARASSYSDLVRELRNKLIFERKVEKRRVYARALNAPAGSLGKAAGTSAAVQMDKEEDDY